MVRKKLDNRIRTLIENGVVSGHRSMFAIVGDKGRDQVVILHHILSKATFKARPSVLWCYKKELGFSSHRKKRMKQLAKKIRNTGKSDINEEDPFELFISSTRIRYCYYNETHKILGNTFGMVVLQDFEALTPNLLARTIETVEGGGLVVFLMKSVTSLRQLYTMAMDVHARYRTEAHQDVVGRFNERFILSLTDCKSCVVVDDDLNILPISSHMTNIETLPPKLKDEPTPSELELKQLKESLQDTQPLGALVTCCKTLDQARAVLKFLDAITEKTLRSTVSLTAARGRGKSAALGLAMAGAIAFGYSNVFVTSPSPENLKTLFDFVFKGFDAIDYQEHTDYELIQSTNPEFNKAVVRVNIFREHRQTIQYIHPSDAAKLGQAELVVIDEAAAIPLPYVKQLFGPYLVFMASTINGYEGTGRSLSLKLLQQLREQSGSLSGGAKSNGTTQREKDKELVAASGRTLYEITLEESIRYNPGDQAESWLNNLLCLDVMNVPRIGSGCPSPAECDLYYVNRDTLFCFHKASEAFLHRLMSIYVAAHYKNTPNDLQMISDAPAHHLFCLLGPIDPQKATGLPEILCVVQVCLEGEISKTSVMSSLSRGKRASGDLIPWTVAQQFQDNDFPTLSGARVVRIATHPDYQSMGYGTRALQLLEQYYEGKIACISEETMTSTFGDEEEGHVVNEETIGLLNEKIAPRRNLPPLLAKLSERRPEQLDWLGVSYGVTNGLLKFWKRSGYAPVYLRQTPNELTGEHSCIMLKVLNVDEKMSAMAEMSWLSTYWKDFRRRFVQLLSYQFAEFHPSLAMSVLQLKGSKKSEVDGLTHQELLIHLSNYDIKRLELYSQNLVDHHLITDLLPTVARLYFLKKLDVDVSVAQSAILLGLGLQHKTIDQLVKDLDLPSSQLLGLFNRAIKKIVSAMNEICEQTAAKQLGEGMSGGTKIVRGDTGGQPIQSLDDDLREGAAEFEAQMRKANKKQRTDLALDDATLSKFAIRATEDDWTDAFAGGANDSATSGKSGLVSVKRKASSLDNDNRRRAPPEMAGLASQKSPKDHRHGKMKKRGGGGGGGGSGGRDFGKKKRR